MRNPFFFETVPLAAELDWRRFGESRELIGQSELALPAASAAKVFKRAGRRATSRVDHKTAGMIQSALAASSILGPLLAAQLRKTPVTQNFIQ